MVGANPSCCWFFSSIDSFVLKLPLHVYIGSKCSSSLYEAFQMEDKSCKGPIYICRTSTDWSQTWYDKAQNIPCPHTKPGSPGQPLQIQVVLISFPPLVFFPPAVQTLHFFTLDLAPFHSAGVSLLAGQWFLPVSLAMLSTAVLFIGLSNLGALMNRWVHTSRRKCRKSSLPPCNFII